MDEKLFGEVIERVTSKLSDEASKQSYNIRDIGVTEFVGTAMGDTIGMVIAGIDPLLSDCMKLGRYRSIGIIGNRSSSLAVQVMAVDDAIKATNCEVINVEPIRDGGTSGTAGGQASIIFIGADDVSDARRAVEITLGLIEKYSGDIYANQAGHVEFHYTARASYGIEKAFGSPVGKAFGMVCGCPAAIGVVLSDVAVKAANVEVVSYTSPASGDGYNYQNEVTLTITGDSGAVKQAVKASIEVGKKLLGAMGDEPKSLSRPYI